MVISDLINAQRAKVAIAIFIGDAEMWNAALQQIKKLQQEIKNEKSI